MTIKLRQNQVKPVQIGVDFFKQKNAKPSIIVAPTAFGKSIVIAKIAESVEDNLLILQPSKELLEQNFKKYISLGGIASIYSASFNSKKIGSVTYATIGSIASIGKTFREKGFTKMIVDEAHLYPRNVDSMFGRFLTDSGITHVLGLTATPLKLQTNSDLEGNTFSKLQMLTSRSKKGNFYKDIIYVSQVEEMVENGFWSKLEYEQYVMDYSGLVYNSTKADFTESSLKEVYKTNDTHGKITTKLEELKDRKSIIVFVPSVAEAKELASITPSSWCVSGDMPKKEREMAINGFKKGTIRVIFNVNVLSVGFDHPELDAIILARPTASFAWFYQALGRGTRISPLKNDCLIVDFSGNVKRFGRVECIHIVKQNTTWKIFGEGGKLLTGIPLHEIGRHINSGGDTPDDTDMDKPKQEKKPENKPTDPKKIRLNFGKHDGKLLSEIDKGYRDWMLDKFEFNPRNEHIKTALLLMRADEMLLQTAK